MTVHGRGGWIAFLGIKIDSGNTNTYLFTGKHDEVTPNYIGLHSCYKSVPLVIHTNFANSNPFICMHSNPTCPSKLCFPIQGLQAERLHKELL